MKLYYYQGTHPNFGDDLNPWLWRQLLPDFFEPDSKDLFLGIGSIIYDFFPKEVRKTVFGSGFGGYTGAPKIDTNWNVHFVRGKITAETLKLPTSLAIGDAAILIRSCAPESPKIRDKISFMPHWESTLDGDWKSVCDIAGLQYIDPCGEVDTVLQQICSSKLLITEAMHGAIVADALRVPWIPLLPIQTIHRRKWEDWASALNLKLSPMQHHSSSLFEAAIGLASPDPRWIGRVRRRGQFMRGIAAQYFKDRAAARLSRIAKTEPSLSSDPAIQLAHARMQEKLEILVKEQKTRAPLLPQ